MGKMIFILLVTCMHLHGAGFDPTFHYDLGTVTGGNKDYLKTAIEILRPEIWNARYSSASGWNSVDLRAMQGNLIIYENRLKRIFWIENKKHVISSKNRTKK